MPQKLGHNEFFSALYFYRKPLSFCKSMYLKTSQISGVGFPQNWFKFCICLGFCFIRKVHREAFPKSTYKYCRIFESLKNLIELCMHLIDVFWGLEKEVDDNEVGYPSHYGFLTFKAIFSEVCVLCFELKLKFTQTLPFLRKIVKTLAKNVVFLKAKTQALKYGKYSFKIEDQKFWANCLFSSYTFSSWENRLWSGCLAS